jgi:hypothetical protein
MERKSAKQYVSPVLLANSYAQLGQREKTVALLEEGYRQHFFAPARHPERFGIYFLHSDERYRSIIRRIGLPQAY